MTRSDRADHAWDRQLPDGVRVVEVGPRDGFQNLDASVPTDDKIRFANRLLRVGFDRVEVTSFVHPDAIPQMADAEAVMDGLRRAADGEQPAADVMVLVPNRHGAERALACGPDTLNFVLSASETHNRANVNQSVADSLEDLAEANALAAAAEVPMRLTIATAFGCPYEGHVDPDRVLDIAARAVEIGMAEIALGDTTGMGNPRQVYHLFRQAGQAIPQVPLAVHLHNTRGAGAANLLAALQAGVRIFDASVGGLGGCPYAPGATGNVCTEDMVHMIAEMDIDTGVDLAALIAIARDLEQTLGIELPGQVMRAGRTCDLVARHEPATAG